MMGKPGDHEPRLCFAKLISTANNKKWAREI